MSQRIKSLEALLAYQETYAPWFTLREDNSNDLIKQDLKLLGRLTHQSELAPDELAQLTEQELKKAISAYHARRKQSLSLPSMPMCSDN